MPSASVDDRDVGVLEDVRVEIVLSSSVVPQPARLVTASSRWNFLDRWRASGIAGRALAVSRWTSSDVALHRLRVPVRVHGDVVGGDRLAPSSSLTSADPVTASIASTACVVRAEGAVRRAQDPLGRDHGAGAARPLLSSSPSPSSSQAASRKAIEGQSAIVGVLAADDGGGRDRVRDGGRGGGGRARAAGGRAAVVPARCERYPTHKAAARGNGTSDGCRRGRRLRALRVRSKEAQDEAGDGGGARDGGGRRSARREARAATCVGRDRTARSSAGPNRAGERRPQLGGHASSSGPAATGRSAAMPSWPTSRRST